ncbi:S8 family serine peptidase [bacterium]|nr:S8 family serine peptidase [bacterium]
MNWNLGLLCGLIWVAANVGHPAEAANAEKYEFKDRVRHVYRVVDSAPGLLSVPQTNQWLKVVRDDRSDLPFWIGSRVVLQLKAGIKLTTVMKGSPLKAGKLVAPGMYLLQATGPREAAAEAHRLCALPEVAACEPEMRRPIRSDNAYAPAPNDPYFPQQWHLEDRTNDGSRLGVDIDARAAWPYATGAGVPVAIVDEGVELQHPDLTNASLAMPHFNFFSSNTFAGPISPASGHGTAVAGLVSAEGNNAIGVSGIAPGANIASWVIFDLDPMPISDLQLHDMFQYESNSIPVQNHSWGYSYFTQQLPGPLTEVGISNAITFGRAGKGVIMVRSAGNDRPYLVNANDDGYPNDPRVIPVAAVRRDGQVTSYSNPGACLLVAAPSGDTIDGFPNLLTTDNPGATDFPHLPGDPEYGLFTGTSASAPIISGLVAMLLEVNPNLTYRDVQQILINAARQTDTSDPLTVTNRAGYRVNLNVGFGVPDAGRAVRLAKNWPLRPAMTNLVFIIESTNQIPNQGLRLETFGTDLPLQLASIAATPGFGLHPQNLTPFMAVVDVGGATGPIGEDLTGKAALIRMGTNTFLEKINNAADAGAALAVIANYATNNDYLLMSNTFRAKIPAVFIKGDDGASLRNYVATNSTAQVRSILYSASYTNSCSQPLLLEHVGVRVKVDTLHSTRGDFRITVTSPAGTRSVLQQLSNDYSPGPEDWTYWSTHFFYESSQGVWTIQISDENGPSTFGSCLYTELILQGVPIKDQDRDGLDDDWEIAHFQNLAARPYEDADDDGESNMAEYIQGTDPLTPLAPFHADIAQWSPDHVRISWPANLNRTYQVLGSTNATEKFNVMTNLPGTFDTGEWFTPTTNFWNQFFMIRSALP